MVRMEEQTVMDKGDSEDDIDDADDQTSGGHAFAFEVSAAAHAAMRNRCEDDCENPENKATAE